jgi:hypothetical protein
VIALAAIALTASRLAASPPGQGASAAALRAGGTPRPAFYLGVYEATSPRSYAGYDSYLRSYADSVRHFGHAVIIGLGHEMNAPWGYPHVRPATFTRKPVLLAETAAGPTAGQPGKIVGLLAGLRRERALGLVWFDEDQHAGICHQDWRLARGTPAAAAFRRGVSALVLAHP